MRQSTKTILLIVITVVAIFFAYLHFFTKDTVTYDPKENPEIQKLLKPYQDSIVKLTHESDLAKQRADVQKEFAMEMIRQAIQSGMKIEHYITNISNFNKKVDAIKNEDELQKLANETYWRVHK